MKRHFAAFAIVFALTPLLCAFAVQGEQEKPVQQVIVESQRALDQHDNKKALALVSDALSRSPEDPSLKVQQARIYAYANQDRQAIAILNSLLSKDPANRDAKLLLAQVAGYREDYRQSDRLYRELLAANPDDESAALGLVHNLALQGKRDEARGLLQQALEHHPASLELQQFNDYLSEDHGTVTRQRNLHRLQTNSTFFSDTSGNRSVYSSQGLVYQFNRKISSRSRVEETALWRAGTRTANVLSGSEEVRFRPHRLVGVRATGGAVRFDDDTSQALYSGDLDLYPIKGLLLSGGFSRFPVSPTFDAAQFDILSEGWHTAVDYRLRNFSITGNLFLTHYNDGNRSEREWAEAMKWFSFLDNKFAVGGGYAFRHLHFARDLNHGYFSPTQYRSHLGAAGIRLQLGKHFRGDYIGYGGGELLTNFSDYSPAGEVLLRNDFFFGKWDISADYSHFHLIQTTGAFRADSVSAGVGFRF